jgi:hypothetical protein
MLLEAVCAHIQFLRFWLDPDLALDMEKKNILPSDLSSTLDMTRHQAIGQALASHAGRTHAIVTMGIDSHLSISIDLSVSIDRYL